MVYKLFQQIPVYGTHMELPHIAIILWLPTDSEHEYYCNKGQLPLSMAIIESVDSISRDGPDTPIYIIHYKKRNNSEQENF